jgi:choline-glycine betaine transporter
MRPWYAFGLDDAGNDEKALFFVTASALFLLAIIGLVNPQFLNSTLTGAYDWVLNYFGWWFMALGFALLIFSFFMVLSRYGNIRIGGQDAEPEFGTFSWLAMVFTVGYSGSIIIWGVGEPVSIVNSPPPQPLPVTGASIESLALSFMFIHEVFPGLAMWYPPFALAFGLIVYTRGTDDYKFSSMLKVIFGEKDRKVYWIVDLAALIAIVGGVAAAIGFTGQVYAALMSNVFGLESSVYTYGLFVVVGLIFLGDVWLGLRKGIRNASRITIVLMILSFGLVLVVGPTLFILEIGLDAAGIWLSNMLRLSLYTAPTAAAANWPQGWTSFWWAWWAAWGLFVGSFVARVSKGRTIRETFVFLVVIPGFLLWVLHSIIGGWVLAPGYIGPVTEALSNGIPAAVAQAVAITPFGWLLGIMLVLVIAGFVLTSLDSAVYILSAITLGNDTPNARNRAWWGALLSFLGIMTLELPVFDAMQAFPTVLALPFTAFILLIAYASYITAREYYAENFGPMDGDPYVGLSDDEPSPSREDTTGEVDRPVAEEGTGGDD